MNIYDAIFILESRKECLENKASGIKEYCNKGLCDNCSYLYFQGNTGEQIEAIKTVIDLIKLLQSEGVINGI